MPKSWVACGLSLALTEPDHPRLALYDIFELAQQARWVGGAEVPSTLGKPPRADVGYYGSRVC
jgi:hypothetical protein